MECKVTVKPNNMAGEFLYMYWLSDLKTMPTIFAEVLDAWHGSPDGDAGHDGVNGVLSYPTGQ